MADKYPATVTVSNDSEGNPVATAEDIGLDAKDADGNYIYDKNTTITWTLTLAEGLSGYGFIDNPTCGITVDTTDSQFDTYTYTSGTEISVKDKNKDGISHTYSITLLAPGGTITTDPAITNRNQN